MCVPIEIVVDRVINPLFVFAFKTEVQRSNAKVVHEGSEVRAGTERADAQVRTLTQFLAFIRRLGIRDPGQLGSSPDRQLALRVLDVARDSVDELLERV